MRMLIQTSTSVNEMVLYSLSALLMIPVEKNQPATIQNANESIRDALKLSKSRSAGLNPSVQQASFLAKVAVLL